MQNQWRTIGPNWLSDELYWRETNGKYRGDQRKGGICVYEGGAETGIPGGPPAMGDTVAWRRYLFYRSGILPDPQKEEGTADGEYTAARWSKTRFNTSAGQSNTPPAYDTAGIKALEMADSDLQLYGYNADYVMVQADFQTLFTNVHSSGEYGIMVECYVDNPRFGLLGYEDEPEHLITSFRLSFGDFNGTRYSFPSPFPQQAVFPVPRNAIKGLIRVSVYQGNGWQTDINPSATAKGNSFEISDGATYVNNLDNVIASDVKIFWCEPIHLSDRLFWIKVENLNGSVLQTDYAPNISRVHLRARLMYGSKDITDRDNCKFVWFRQKYSALRSMADEETPDEFGNTWAGYLPEGEQGWAPITHMMKTPAEDPIFGEHTGGDNYELGFFANRDSTTLTAGGTFHEGLSVPINKVPWKWKYLVVCYYNPGGGNLESIQRSRHNDALVWQEQTITNRSSIYDFELPAPITTLDGIGLRVRNNIVPWEDGVPYDTFHPEKPDPEKDWYGRWWALEGNTYNTMQISNPTDDNDKRYVKGKKKIDHWATNSPITFKVQVFGSRNPSGDTITEKTRNSALWPEVVKPTAVPPGLPSETEEYPMYEIANLERAIIPDNDSLFHVQFYGDRAHYYNSNGSIRDFGSDAETQYNIWAVVTPRDDSIRISGFQWLAPDRHPLYGEIKKAYTPDGNDSMIHSSWVSDPAQRKMLHYKVAQTYDVDRVAAERNTFILQIVLFGGQTVDIECPITFITADGNGANGTEWEATIWPTNNTPSLDDETTISETPWTWDVQNHPRTLVVNGNLTYDEITKTYAPAAPSGSMNWSQNNEYKLFLRPFIKRKNVPIESLTESSRYSYKVYWDVRYPVVKAPDTARGRASGGSFLKFNHVGVSGRSPSDYGRDGNSAGIAFKPGTTNPPNYPFQAYTHSRDRQGMAWDGDGNPIPWEPTGLDKNPKTYGAIEVQWRGAFTHPDSTIGPVAGHEIATKVGNTVYRTNFAELGYSFVVKAQIDIFYDNKKVQTIFSYYGADILFANGINFDLSTFKPSMIKTTWPKDVKYSPTGIAPVARSEFLQFYYGPNRNTPLNAEPPHPISAYPVNLTPQIQDLSLNLAGLNPMGAYSPTTLYQRTDQTAARGALSDVVSYEGFFYKVKNVGLPFQGIAPDQSSLDNEYWVRVKDTNRQMLLPRPYYFFDQFDNGAVMTDLVWDTGKWPAGSKFNPDFTTWYQSTSAPTRNNTAKYVRTIVYRLSQFANDDINGWDGKSIDLNEENGTIFAPTIGAGWKHPFTNTFTGVIMGIDKSQLRNAYADDYGGFGGEAVDQMKYMVGLYGYQDGVNSFGILENGTAFFGRVDRGGRIIIDGFNAQIYGGVSVEKKTGLDANMRNRMRLSFIDFGGAAATAAQLSDPNFLDRGMLRDPSGATQTTMPTQGLDVDGMPAIEMGAFEVELEQDIVSTRPAPDRWFGKFRDYFAPGRGRPGTVNGVYYPGEDPLALKFGGFATGHGFSTPAIEIGSYEDWVKKANGDRIEETRQDFKFVLDANETDVSKRLHKWRTGRQLVREYTVEQVRALGQSHATKLLEIPGFRRFLVTYDGTLYAMNAFIMGTIMGSNIIGSRFFTDTGAGVLTNNIFAFGPNGPNTMRIFDQPGEWSRKIPTTKTQEPSRVFEHLPGTLSEFRQGGTPGDTHGNGFHFAVGTDGTVIANKLHITGGSISLGSFHVVNTTGKEGDVYSFGTLYLIGPADGESRKTPGAVQGWGDFYLRGRLVNIGQIFLGATPEKRAGWQDGTIASDWATSFNSPFSLMPKINDYPTATKDFTPNPEFPIKMGMWPLYFQVGSITDITTNNTWITLASTNEGTEPTTGANNGYMPVFSWRPSKKLGTFDTDDNPTAEGTLAAGDQLADNVIWRLDQLGMWTDGLFFTRKSWRTITDTGALDATNHALLYQGWLRVPKKAGGNMWGFAIKNMSSNAPDMFIETPNNIRISSGKDVGIRGSGAPADGVINSVIIEGWANGAGAKLGGVLVVSGGPSSKPQADAVTAAAGTVGLVGMSPDRSRPGDAATARSQIRGFITINGLQFADDPIIDERGRIITLPPASDAAYEGKIWIKSKVIVIDAAHDYSDVSSRGGQNNVQIRLNRTFDGDTNAGLPQDLTVSGTERIPSQSLLGMRSNQMVVLSASGTDGNIHIYTGGVDNSAATNEIYMIQTGGIMRLNAATELTLGVASVSHDRPTNHLRLLNNEFRIVGYTPAQQFGIYARFA